MAQLPSLDTKLAFATTHSHSISYEPGLKSPTNKSSAFPRTPATGLPPKTPLSAFSKSTEEDIPVRRLLGRRNTTRTFNSGDIDESEALAYDGDNDALTKVGNFLYKIHSASVITRYSLYILPVATLLAIPLIITANPPHDNARADGIRLLGLFIWVEISWLTFWVAKLVAQVLPIVFQAACGLISAGVRKYSLVLRALEIPMSILIWAIICFSTTDVIFVFDKIDYHENGRGEWIRTLKRAFRTGIIAAVILVIEKTVIQLISINYYRKQYARKIRESKRLISLLDLLYETSRSLFPEFSKDFEHEDTEIHNTFVDLKSKLDQKGISVGSKLLHNVTRARDKAAAAFGAMASDVTGQQLHTTTHAHSVVLKALESERASKALARRLWLSLCASGKDAIYKQDILEVLGPGKEAEADEIFNILDRDGNGDVSLEEMTILIVNCGYERRDRASSIQDISSAIAVLDKILSVGVLIGIAFLYALIFSKTFASKTTQIWTSVASLAFSIGGTVTEFFACCIFLFVKHPYDVGDRVTIEEQELVVKHISLMYSIFKRIDNDSVVQIPHNIANTLWIENVTRSKAMKERIKIKIAFFTKMEDLLALRKEMERFVTAPENRHDFMPEFDLEITSVEDLYSLEIRIEVRHKSNFANESLRLHRRNKFMCELLEAIRRIPIERPRGNWGPANPTYTCELTDEEAVVHQKTKKEGEVNTKLYPPGTDMSELLPSAPGGGLLSPAQAMYPGMKKRTLFSQENDTGRRPSIWSPL